MTSPQSFNLFKGEEYPAHSPLLDAVKGRNQELVKKLINSGIDVNTLHFKKETCLYQAIENSDREMVTLLLNAGAAPNFFNNWDCPPLQRAVECNDTEMVELLIKAGADVNTRRSSNWTTLDSALILKHASRSEMVKLLLEHGADPNPATLEAGGALYMAALFCLRPKNGYENSDEKFSEIARLLFAHGADGTKMSLEKHNATLQEVLKRGSTDTLKLLLDHGFNLDQSANWSETPLHFAIYNKNIDILEHLLNLGIFDVDGKGGWGYWQFRNEQRGTALHLAVHLNKLDHAKLLLEYGAFVDSEGSFKTPSRDNRRVDVEVCVTPLYRAFRNGQLEFAKILLAHGARVAWEHNWPDKAALAWSTTFKKDKSCFELAITHLALQEDQGFPLDLTRLTLYKQKIISILTRCRSELNRVKHFVIHDSVTFYDLLVKEDISLFVKNEDFSRKFKVALTEIREQFRYYGPVMNSRASMAFKKQELIDSASFSLSKILRLDVVGYRLVYSAILRYLNSRDLHRLRNL